MVLGLLRERPLQQDFHLASTTTSTVVKKLSDGKKEKKDHATYIEFPP